MSHSTYSIRPFHVYTLRTPLAPNSPIKYVLVLVNPELANRHPVQIVTALPLRFNDASVATDIRVRIQCKGTGGTAQLPADVFASVDNMFPVPKRFLIEHSGTEIAEDEKADIRRKIANWLGL